jgi:UDP-N-acetylmuramoylalanine--D-glutamate ligase
VYWDAKTKRVISKITGKEEVYDLSQFRLFGEHNRENLMAAICTARAMGVDPKAIQNVIQNFKGVPHRLEFIRKKDGVFFFNDSKGTNVMSVQRSLSSFSSNPIILIAGGKDKGMDFTPLCDLVKRKCKILILLGEAKEKINRSIGDFAETYLVGTFEEAVLLAYQKSRSGDIILLSPGCASYDMFKNYEERGDYFKKLVSQL